MSQSKKHSLMESLLNTGSAFLISWFVFWAVIPLLFNIETGPGKSAGIVLIFTLISVARNYIWRRIFNSLGAAQS